MAFTTEQKQQIIKEYQTQEGDTGSSQVQIALLTERIRQLTEHFKTHKKDHHSRRGLLKLVGKRNNLIKYMKNTDPAGYATLKARLGLRR
jgi:small subunit ribosomal protein S15